VIVTLSALIKLNFRFTESGLPVVKTEAKKNEITIKENIG